MAMREWITKDLAWKLFSLALAIAIWLTIRHETATSASPFGAWTTRTFTNLPVLVVSSAADVREFKVDPGRVAVTVSGRPEIVAALQENEIRVIVDLTEIETARVLRKRVDVSAPPGVTFVRVVPPQVDVAVPPTRDKK